MTLTTGPVSTSSPRKWWSSQAKLASVMASGSPASVRQAPWPPQYQSIETGTSLLWRISKFVIASRSVNSVSTVPWTSRVGVRIWSTRSPGPRSTNHPWSSSLSVPVAWPEALALAMWGSRLAPSATELSTPAQPAFTVSLG